MKIIKSVSLFSFAILLFSCSNGKSDTLKNGENITLEIDSTPLKDSVTVYKTDQLVITKLTENVYQHISFLVTQDFGSVPCNGMIVINENQAVIFDTPTDNAASLALINYIQDTLKCKVKAIIPTHFHLDCIGGLAEFKKSAISIYASTRTAKIMREKGKMNGFSIREFQDELILPIGNKKVYAAYFGEGHTTDNVVGYFPDDQILFGGCLVKEMDATKGNLEDANEANWSKTVRKLRDNYPELKIIIPGHGKIGGTEILDYTIQLFENKNN